MCSIIAQMLTTTLAKQKLSFVRCSIVTILLVLVAGFADFQTPVGAQTVDASTQQLADTYAPIVQLHARQSACDNRGEGYFPAPVDWIFNKPDIQLRADAGGNVADDPVLLRGFTPQELAAAGSGTYIDFPGDPRHPGCLPLRDLLQAGCGSLPPETNHLRPHRHR